MNNINLYQQRINKSLDYINKHLSEDLNIKLLAEKSHFSPFHFQRIYKSIQGETPYETLFRLRLEKSVFLIKNQSSLSLKDVASQVGFRSYENFSRQFKTRFKITPTQFKKNKTLQQSRIYQEINENDFYHCYEESRTFDPVNYDIQLEQLNEIPIAFIRGIFGNDGSILVQRYQELMNWAKENNINTTGKLTRFGMSIDNPEVTPASKFRYDFALSTSLVKTDSPLIELGTIPAGTYATLHCQGDLTAMAQAWDYLYKYWLPNSEYTPADYPAIEEFIQGPEEIGWGNFNIKCRIPITKQKAI